MRSLLLAATLIATPAAAEVVQSTPIGFEVKHTISVAAPPDKAWPVVTAPRLWWDKDHTYSDDPANLTLDERPGGCFCEKLPGKGGVEHMRVVYIQPPLMIRMTGGLGPLQAEGATGTLAITLKREGEATTITLSYVIGGYMRMGTDKLAPVVDRVLGQQMAGLKAAIERGPGAPAVAAPGKAPAAKAAGGKAATPDKPDPRIDAEPLADVEQTIAGLTPPADSAATAPEAPPAEATPPPVQVTPKPRPADQDSPR